MGIYNYASREPVDKNIFEKALDAIAHRGPDEQGCFYDDEAGLSLGSKRLSIIDLNTGRQPLLNEDGSVVLVANGEIYNFPELREDLARRGHQFKTRSDNETIVHAYETHEIRCVERLNGMFAFALWDRNERLLLLARDRMGVKPLYYALQNDSICFSSELKGLLALPFIQRDLNLDSLNKYLTFGNVPSPHSIIKNIFKLEAGKILTIRNGRLKISPYWDLATGSPKLDISEEEAAEELERLFREAVRKRLQSDVPLGVFLSGGIDSSLVTKFAADISPGRIRTFSIGFDEKSFDESKIAMRFAKELGGEHYPLLFNSQECLKLIPRLADLVDEPLSDASILPTYCLSRFASKQVKVCLGGDGGDELFAGYPIFFALKFAVLYDLLPRPMKKMISFVTYRIPPRDTYMSLPFVMKQFLRGTEPSIETRMFAWMGAYLDPEKKRLLNPDIARGIEGTTFEDIAGYLGLKSIPSEADRMLYLIAKLFLIDDVLVKVDRASMATGLEVRGPFLDYTLQDFVARLPYEFKLRRLTSKFLLKKMAGRHLPAYIIHRKKQGFAVPVAKWLKRDLKELLLHYTGKNYLENQGLFQHRFVEKLVQDHLNESGDHRKSLWNLLVFQLWHEKYKPNVSPS